MHKYLINQCFFNNPDSSSVEELEEHIEKLFEMLLCVMNTFPREMEGLYYKREKVQYSLEELVGWWGTRLAHFGRELLNKKREEESERSI